jgi:hypothetical protein
MTVVDLQGHGGAPVAVDMCTACHAFWFDRHESVRLAPASTLRLFTLIGEHTSARPAFASRLRCPRCSAPLIKTQDRQRSTTFGYWRCDQGHGRFITYFDFLREKDFIRPLSGEQINELRRSVQSVNCSNCGAPIDLNTATTCASCGSPLSMIDLRQAEALMEQLKKAAAPRAVDPALPLELARARREVEAAFATVPGHEWWKSSESSDLVGMSLSRVIRWIRGT